MKTLKRHQISNLAQLLFSSPKEANEFLLQLASLTSGILFLFDIKNGKLVFANEQLHELLGYSVADVNSFAGDFTRHLIHPDDFKTYKQLRKKTRSKSKQVFSQEMRVKKKSGHWLDVHFRSIFLESGGKKSALMLGVIDDRSQTRQLKKQQDKEKLQVLQTEKFAALNDMAGGIAHEINNPLAIILGRAQSMRMRIEKGASEPKQLIDGLEKIEKTVNRISEIIGALRLVTRDGSKDPFVPTPIELVLKDVKTVWNQRLINHGIAFTIGSFDPQLTAVCRPSQIATVLINLVSNAFQAVKSVSQPKISIDVENRNEDIEIAISDNGLGIPPQHRDRIFNAFFTTKPVGEGTGLGLTIASGLIKDHHGELFLDQNSKLTRFVMRIPKNIYIKKNMAA